MLHPKGHVWNGAPLICAPCRGMLRIGIDEQRLVLTRDTSVPSQRDSGHVYLVSAVKKAEQLAEVVSAFQIPLDAADIMTRCTFCGGEFLPGTRTFQELPEASEVRVRPEVQAYHNEFWVCSLCSKVFWKGDQFKSAVRNLTARCRELGGFVAADAAEV